MLLSDEEDDYDGANYYSERDPAMCAPELVRKVGQGLCYEGPLIRGWRSIAEELSEYRIYQLEEIARSADPGITILHSWISEKGNAATLGVLLLALHNIQRQDLVGIFNREMRNISQLSAVLKDTNGNEHVHTIQASGRGPLWRLLRFWLHDVVSSSSCRSYFQFDQSLSHMKWNIVSQKFKGIEIGICQVDEDRDLTWKKLTTDGLVIYLDHSNKTLAIENSVLVRAEQVSNDLVNDSSQLTFSDIVWNLEESP